MKKVPKERSRNLIFRKSTHSQYQWNPCVEVAIGDDFVAVRDSKDPEESILQFSHDEWKAFLNGVKDGEFDIA